MKICLKCHKKFPFLIIIDGKRRNIQRRKYCLDCSPFGEHNTVNLHEPDTNRAYKRGDVDSAPCPNCNKIKPANEFYRRKNGDLSGYCCQCVNNTTIIRQQELKTQAARFLGGVCQVCGYDKYVGAMHFIT